MENTRSVESDIQFSFFGSLRSVVKVCYKRKGLERFQAMRDWAMHCIYQRVPYYSKDHSCQNSFCNCQEKSPSPQKNLALYQLNISRRQQMHRGALWQTTCSNLFPRFFERQTMIIIIIIRRNNWTLLVSGEPVLMTCCLPSSFPSTALFLAAALHSITQSGKARQVHR